MNILEERHNLGLEQRETARKIGVPEHVLRYAESGGKPRPRSAKKIADFYGVKVTDIWPVPDVERTAF